MKIRLAFAISAIVCLAAGCAKEPPEKSPPVKIAINQFAGYATAFLAEEKGFFKKNGVDVELVFRKGTPESLALFKSGETSGCFDTFTDIILISAQGTGARIVCVMDYSYEGDAIIARAEIESVSDLKDKTVSFEGVNTFSHFFVLKALEKAGLDESDLKFADIEAAGVLQAIEEGRIDAGHTWEPTKSQALKSGHKIIARAGDIPGMIIDALVFDPQTVLKRPDDVKAVVKSIFEARDYLKLHPGESIAIMARRMGMTEEEMASGLEGIYQPDLKENVELLTTTTTTTTTRPPLRSVAKAITEFYLNRGQLSSLPDVGCIIEPRFAEELSKR